MEKPQAFSDPLFAQSVPLEAPPQPQMRKDVFLGRCLSAKMAIIHTLVILFLEEGERTIYENVSKLHTMFAKKKKQAKTQESSLKRDHAGFDFVCIFRARLHA